MPVVITSNGIFNPSTAVSTPANVAPATGAAQDIQAGLGTLVGAFIDETQYTGGLTHAQAITHWNSNSGRTMACERLYIGKGNMPTTVPANVSACATAGRSVVLSYKPLMNGMATPLGSASTQTVLDGKVTTFLTALNTAGFNGSNCLIDLWQEPINSGITGGSNATAANFITMFQHYAPIIRSFGFTVGFCTSAASVFSSGENNYYPGDPYCDIVATDYYFPQYGTGAGAPLHPLGSGLSTDAAHPADAASPPKPFGIYELNSSTDPTQGCTKAQATAYWNYLLTYFQTRLAANQPCAPLCIFNSDSGSANPRDSAIVVADGTTDPYGGGTATEYRNGFIAALVDGLAAVT